MPVYSFQLAAFLAGKPVTVRDAGGDVAASGVLDGDAGFSADLAVGDYVASATDGRYTYRSAGTVPHVDPDSLAAKADVSYVDAQLAGKLDTTTANSTFGRQEDITPLAVAPLDIPVYDGNPGVTHPSVAAAPNGTWNGYRLWMAFTPYPVVTRENPSVVASRDGVNWEVPEGLTNPVVPLSFATAEGFDYNSDTHLVFDGDTLVMFFRCSSDTTEAESIYRTESTDGVTWSAPVELISVAANDKTVSPAVIIEADGTWKMWTVDASVVNVPVMNLRTSPDGLTWSAPTVCTHANGTDPWHIDVQKAAGRYHVLVYDKTGPSYLNYLTSADGITWDGTTAYSLPQSGLTWDQDGYYRSCFLPVPGKPLKWDMWVAGRGGGSYRIGYVPAFDWNQAIEDYKRQSAEAAMTKRNRALVVDSFYRRSANGIGKPEVGASWTWYPGSSTAQPSINAARRFVFPVNATNGALMSTGAKNGWARVEAYIDGTGTNADGGIVFRATDNANCLFVALTKTASLDRVSIWKRDAGASTKLAENLTAGMIRDASYDLEVRFLGDKVTVYLDRVQVLTYTLTAAELTTYGTRTGVGLWGPGGGVTFSNFVHRSA